MRTRISLRDRSGRSSVWVKKKRSADTVLFIVGAARRLALMNLEPTNVLGRRRIGRATEKGCKATTTRM